MKATTREYVRSEKARYMRDARNMIRAASSEISMTEPHWDNMAECDARAVYLGTVMALTPSGKYYVPFACSNVEVCSVCKGSGCDACDELGSLEAAYDERFREAAEHAANLLGMCYESGEDCPTDLFLVQYEDN